MGGVVIQTDIPGYSCRRGKVRDVYDLGDVVLIVACDRLSAFDVVLPDAIPGKGQVLTRLAGYWFEHLSSATPHHLLEIIDDRPPAALRPYRGQLRGRAMICRKCEVIPIECVVRGYLAGSGWADYRRNQSVCGVRLPEGLVHCQQLAEPMFSPATKAEQGHDQNISFEQACTLVGRDTMEELRRRSLDCYREAAQVAAERGLLIADTKFEWGRRDGELILIDEILTPDSSRFWPAADYCPGRDQSSFDKQYVRDYLQGLVDRGLWNKTPPGPHLPPEVIRNTTNKYLDAYRRLTGCGDIAWLGDGDVS